MDCIDSLWSLSEWHLLREHNVSIEHRIYPAHGLIRGDTIVVIGGLLEETMTDLQRLGILSPYGRPIVLGQDLIVQNSMHQCFRLCSTDLFHWRKPVGARKSIFLTAWMMVISLILPAVKFSAWRKRMCQTLRHSLQTKWDSFPRKEL